MRSSYFNSRITTVIFTVLTPLLRADWTFRSRPDLSPPVLNITIPASAETSPDYLFVTPRGSRRVQALEAYGPVQAGAYIFKFDGELVWSGVGSFLAATNNFQPARLHGEDVLIGFESDATSWQTRYGKGHAKILNRDYETVTLVAAANHVVADKHEFHIMNEETALFVSYTPVPYDLRGLGNNSPRAQWLLDGIFQEVDIETGDLLFEWRSLDHVSPDECVVSLSTPSLGSGFHSTDAIDFFHINSVDGNGRDYLISGRRTSTIYKIDGTTGDIIWRLGGKYSNFTFGPGAEFGLQHDARFIPGSEDGHTETISLLDNNGRHIDSKAGWENQSSGKILSLDTKNWTASLVQVFPAPHGIFAFEMGNTQVLANKNVLVNWGAAGAVTEFSPNGTVIFHAYLDSGELYRAGKPASYRGFKSSWKGTPREEPAVVALKHGESTTLYVSWNGDTETKIWRFYGVDDEGKEVLLGEEERTGFETSFHTGELGTPKMFLAKAVGAENKVLRVSKAVKPKLYIKPHDLGKDDFAAEESDHSAFLNTQKSEL
ncbi:hypothetical protein JHW43_007971 [Diplocarpon mali]|nr:hypothetical protein JHW43_007971 [Diplocarpon mali]